MNKKYDIILASYNGEKYIAEQLDSLIVSIQNCNFISINQLIITDDGSTDATKNIIDEYIEKYPYIRYYKNNGGKGVVNNFQNGIDKSTSDYILFSDQDDIWHRDKVSKTLEALIGIDDKPFLVITNICLVDENRKPLKGGHDFLSTDPANPQMTAYRSFGQGCCMGINRKLIDMVGHIPSEAVMHDWWFLLIASHFGKVKYIEEPLLEYRQHTQNVFGGMKRRRFSRFFDIQNQKKYITTLSIQSKKFIELYGDFIENDNLLKSHIFLSDIENKNYLERMKFYFSGNLKIRGLKNKIKFLIQLISI